MEGAHNEDQVKPDVLTRLRTLLVQYLPAILFDPIKEEEIEPSMFELQYFYWVRRTSHRDGESIPEHGFVFERLFYGDDVVYMRSIPYVHGIPDMEHVESKGYQKMLFMASLAKRYLAVMKIADHLGGIRHMRQYKNELVLSPKLHEALVGHPQYADLEEYWRCRGKVLDIRPRGDQKHVYLVELQSPR